MIIFPAIDLKDGLCVRLKRGVMSDATVFNADPDSLWLEMIRKTELQLALSEPR